MLQSLSKNWLRSSLIVGLALCFTWTSFAQENSTAQKAEPQSPASSQPMAAQEVPKGLRVFSCGHSFHYFMPPILTEIAKSAGITDHKFAGISAIGGSRVIQHWDVPDAKNQSKQALQAGTVDVLTLAPIHLPDPGIENYARLAFEHNPQVRVTVQEFWLPFDLYDTTFKLRPAKTDFNAQTGESLRKLHAPYFESMDEHVRSLNKKFGKTVVYVVPVGQAVIALREKIIAGEAPGLKEQADLFTDPLGHAHPPLQALVAYCHYVSIYRRSPVGLPVPTVMSRAKNPNWGEPLNKLLQQIAWETVSTHPLAGIRDTAP